jgi:hypothetical protein
VAVCQAQCAHRRRDSCLNQGFHPSGPRGQAEATVFTTNSLLTLCECGCPAKGNLGRAESECPSGPGMRSRPYQAATDCSACEYARDLAECQTQGIRKARTRSVRA